MSRYTIPATLILGAVFGGMAFFVHVPEPTQDRWLKIDTPEVNLGKHPGKKALSCHVTLRNTHDKTIEITDIMKTCACVGASTDSRILEPGHVTGMRVDLETGRKLGKRRQTVLIRYRVDGSTTQYNAYLNIIYAVNEPASAS